MNVIISNQLDNITAGLNIEIIKALNGEFEADELINTFSNFFFSRMILDVTALKDYTNIITYQKLSIGLPVDKIILLLPSQSEVSGNMFLSKLISMGYYNFTTNLEGIEYLLQHPNSYRDVAHIHQIEETSTPIVSESFSGNRNVVIGIKNVTDGAGATTLTYLMYKELKENYGINTLVIEVSKRDFSYFNDNEMISTSKNELAGILLKNRNYEVILVDLNDSEGDICSDTLYLVEPSIIKMNKLMRRDRMIFNRLRGKKIVLNKTVITKSDIREFEAETGIRAFYVMPPIDDRSRQRSILGLLGKLGLIKYNEKGDD